MKTLSQVFLTLLLGLFVFQVSAQNDTADQSDPEEMIEQVSNNLLVAIDRQRTLLTEQPHNIKPFAETYVLPYVDAPKMARYVMGRYWRVASENQKNAFVSAFTDTLVRSYAGSLLKLNVTEVKVDTKKLEKPGRYMVPSEVTQSDGNVTSIIYRTFLDKKTQKWMIFDVSIEGISLLLNYRKSYASEFSKKGVSKVIKEMQIKNAAFLAPKSE